MAARVRQFTKAEAIAFAQREDWKRMTPMERGMFQLHQDKLCMPFSVFHEGVTELLGRPVYTHEFGLNLAGLIAEAEGRADAPTMEQIIGLLPPEKVIVVAMGGAQ
jgi:hypothetical protein